MTEATTIKWLDETREILAALNRQYLAVRSRLAPDFLALDFLRTDELGLSRIIAHLLDPRGAHGQGHQFLKLFLHQFWPEMEAFASGAKIQTEAPTANGRRIDIKIELEPAGTMGIENKIRGAADQKCQISDYLSELSRRNNKHRLLYLCPTRETEPSNESIDKDKLKHALSAGTLTCPGTQDLREWIKLCIAECESHRVRSFLDELLLFINKRLIGETDINNSEVIAKHAIASKENLSAAIEVHGAIESIRKAALEKFIEILYAKFSNKPLPSEWELHMNDKLNIMAPHSMILLGPRNNAKYKISIEFYSKDLVDVAIGIWKPIENNTPLIDEKIRATMVNEYGTGKSDPRWWPWYMPFKHNNWLNPDKITLLLDGGESGMAAIIKAEFERVIETLEKNNLIPEFTGTQDQS